VPTAAGPGSAVPAGAVVAAAAPGGVAVGVVVGAVAAAALPLAVAPPAGIPLSAVSGPGSSTPPAAGAILAPEPTLMLGPGLDALVFPPAAAAAAAHCGVMLADHSHEVLSWSLQYPHRQVPLSDRVFAPSVDAGPEASFTLSALAFQSNGRQPVRPGLSYRDAAVRLVI
jgi:hypothetical protein